jgi:hypothetical protein
MDLAELSGVLLDSALAIIVMSDIDGERAILAAMIVPETL